MLVGWLDHVLYRHPFEGASASRYARLELPAFGDLHERLAAEIVARVPAGGLLLELGAGPGIFSAMCAAMLPAATRVVAIDPSRAFARRRADFDVLRAAGEALPLADRSVDVAVCLSSIRHVRDRTTTLRELRRVVRDALFIIELDPRASDRRIAAHADHLAETSGPLTRWWLRRTFGPLVVRTAPPAERIIELARGAGWHLKSRRDDSQPVYILELAKRDSPFS